MLSLAQGYCPNESSDRPRTGLRVLLAEADAASAEFMTLLLQMDGHQVHVARTGPSALEMAQAAPPDVVVLEIGLPGMDGWDVARRLKEQASEKRPFIIAVTTYCTEADRRRSAEAGIHLHLSKPVKFAELRKVLRRLYAIMEPAEYLETRDTRR
jgi:two-component system, OmpR family, response regulator